ncbi:transcription termination factor NusA [Myxococcota bacterium]|jgi:N utilization substance protein A|nr:transcription termination factor NusA [Myxococcota bacterium]MBU1511540.1 transcription termination factor NusA [Myxococcota bacterium]PKN27273.1 MAG: transcription termination factor NusA [Deltaproteobacteria bacterium HGW-Deltaproteobacteria-22]
MQFELDKLLESVSRDKNIDKAILVDTLEQAILSAARKVFGANRQLEARYNAETGTVELFLILTITENTSEAGVSCTFADAKAHGLEAEVGDEILFQIFYHPTEEKKAIEQEKQFGKLLNLKDYRKTFGRIAAQTAKQVIIQRVRAAERETIYKEFKDRVGDVINGVVRRFEKGNIIVDIGRTEAVLTQKEQIATESYRAGDRIVAYVKEVRSDNNKKDSKLDPRGPQISLSRREEGLVRRLFEMEVPEIFQGIVTIEAIAREPGSRTKIAVSSRDRDVDPVGACVGLKGLRVQNIKQFLKGEKIDIVPWDSESARFVCNSIAPSQVSKIIVDSAAHTMELIIPDDQLSLAIGKRGQNVRLASQLTGWKIDIYSESKVVELEKRMRDQIASIEGVGEDLAETIFKLGWRSLEDVAQANPEDLASIPGLGGLESAIRISSGARLLLEMQDGGEEMVSEDERILELQGVDDYTLTILKSSGYTTVAQIYQSTPEEMTENTGIALRQCQRIHYSAGVSLGLEDRSESKEFAQLGYLDSEEE